MTDLPKQQPGTPFKEKLRPTIAWFITNILGIPIWIFYRVRVLNYHALPMRGPLLLAANHVSWVDPVLVTIASRRQPVRFVVTRGFYKKPFVYFFCWVYGAIPIDKNNPRAAIQATIHALRQGDLVCIFPEGGLTKDGTTRQIMRGVEMISRAAKAPVLPVRIRGMFGTALTIRREWRKQHLWEKPWPKVEVRIGNLIAWETVSREAVAEQLDQDENS